MFCGKCGTKIPDGGRFCPECGADVSGHTLKNQVAGKPEIIKNSEEESLKAEVREWDIADYDEKTGEVYSENRTDDDHDKSVNRSFVIAIIVAAIMIFACASGGFLLWMKMHTESEEIKETSTERIDTSETSTEVAQGQVKKKETEKTTEKTESTTTEKRTTEKITTEEVIDETDYSVYEGNWYSSDSTEWILNVTWTEKNHLSIGLAYHGGYIVEPEDVWPVNNEADFNGNRCSGRVYFGEEYILFEFDETSDAPSSYVYMDLRSQNDIVYDTEPKLYQVNVGVDNLMIYSGPGYDYEIAEVLSTTETLTVVSVSRDSEGNYWGELKSGIGWIDLSAPGVIPLNP